MATTETPNATETKAQVNLGTGKNFNWNLFGKEYTKRVKEGKNADTIAAELGLTKADLNIKSTRLRKMLKDKHGINLPKIKVRGRATDLSGLASELADMLADDDDDSSDESEESADENAEQAAEQAEQPTQPQNGGRRGRR